MDWFVGQERKEPAVVATVMTLLLNCVGIEDKTGNRDCNRGMKNGKSAKAVAVAVARSQGPVIRTPMVVVV